MAEPRDPASDATERSARKPDRDEAPHATLSASESTGAIALAVRRPVATTMVVVAAMLFGAVSFARLPVNLLPDVSYPTLTVRAEYEGAGPADVEKLVTRQLEEELAVVSGLLNHRSVSRAEVSDVILQFEWDTAMTFAAQDVRDRVDQVLRRLPQGVARPLVLRYDPTLDPIMRLSLSPRPGEDLDLYELRRLAEDEIERALESGLPGVAAVRVRGGFEEEWRIELDERRLEDTGLTAAEIADRIGLENANVAGGVLRDGDREALVRTLGEIRTPEELEGLVVAEIGDAPITVGDLGRVIVGHKERDVITRVDGAESVEIEIYKEAEANLVGVANAVKARLFGPKWRTELVDGRFQPAEEAPRKADQPKADGEDQPKRGPPKRGDKAEALFKGKGESVALAMRASGAELSLVSDQSVFIEQALDEVKQAGLIGAALAILVLFLFLRRLGPTIVIAVTIPVSIVATFLPMALADVSLNVMSLGGLALGIGMLVDSAIVVLEAIARRREAGQAARPAAVLGTREVGLAVLASTLTTIAVFLPIVFVEGVAGEFFRDQALAVCFSLIAALIAALFFIPMLSALQGPSSLGKALTGGERSWLWPLNEWIALEQIGRAVKRGGWTMGPSILFEALIRLPLEGVFRVAWWLVRLATLLIGSVIFGLFWGLSFVLRPIGRGFDWLWLRIERLYGGLLKLALRVRLLIVVAAVAIGWIAYERSTSLGIELIPEVHQGAFAVRLDLDVGTPVARTDEIARETAELVADAAAAVGVPLVGSATSAGVPRDVIARSGEGTHTARVGVRIGQVPDLEAAEDALIEEIRSRLDGRAGFGEPIFERPALFTSAAALEIEVVGERLEAIGKTAAALEEELREVPGLIDVESSLRTGRPEIVVTPDRGALIYHGLRAGTVAQNLRDKVLGKVSTRISRGDRKIDVLVRAPRSQVGGQDAVLGLTIGQDDGAPIPLRSVAQVSQRPGPAEIRRIEGERAVVLRAGIEGLDLGGASERVKRAVDRFRSERPELFREVIVRVAGQSKESDSSLRSLGFALLVAVFLVYVVMASQFESLVQPLVILFTVPLALVGVVFALEIFGIGLGIIVLLGVILLVGIVVNNAIVLVDCINRERASGMARDEAIARAGRLRLRPILMTTATTVLGLLPLALGLGEGSELRRPMAVTVVAGLITSTLLTLVVIPVVYSLVTRAKAPTQESAA